MNKRGLVLILVLGILAVLIITAAAFISLTAGETRMVKRQGDSVRAFYLAESGIEEAIYRLKAGTDDDFKGHLYSGEDEYDVDMSEDDSTYTVTSTGSYPNLTDPDKVTRTVKVDVTVAPAGDPDSVTNAIEVNGTVQTSGNVTINGTIEQNSNVDFQSIFGVTKEQMEAMAFNKYVNPPNSHTPVSQITWVNLINNAEFKISQTGWSGSGILIVKEPTGATSPALTIDGGQFEGVIWVIGNLRISGNANISGAIFAENGSAEVTRLTGTPVISYDDSDVEDAFEYLGNSIGAITNWQEIYQ